MEEDCVSVVNIHFRSCHEFRNAQSAGAIMIYLWCDDVGGVWPGGAFGLAVECIYNTYFVYYSTQSQPLDFAFSRHAARAMIHQ